MYENRFDKGQYMTRFVRTRSIRQLWYLISCILYAFVSLLYVCAGKLICELIMVYSYADRYAQRQQIYQREDTRAVELEMYDPSLFEED